MIRTDADGRLDAMQADPAARISSSLIRREWERVSDWTAFLDSPEFSQAKEFGERIERERHLHKQPTRKQAPGFRPGTKELDFEIPPYIPAPLPPPKTLLDGSGPDPFRHYQEEDEDICSKLEDTDHGRHALAGREQWEKILLHETGKIGNPEELRKSEARKAELERMSYRVAQKLEAAGIEAFDRSDWRVLEFFPLSGTVTKLPPFRRINILPTVAQANRAKLVRALESELERYPFARMFTFTSGTRVPLSRLRERIQSHHRRLSKLAHFLKSLGIEMFWRSTELGTPRDFDKPEAEDRNAGTISRDERGEITFHVHSHCCIRLIKDRPFTKEGWEEVKAAIKSRWIYNWDDSGLIGRQDNGDRKPLHVGARELVKYVTKPTELDKLSANETADLYRALYRLRLVTPMGRLKTELKARREAKEALYRERTREGDVWQWRADWNRHAMSKPSLKDVLDATNGAYSTADKDKAKDTEDLIVLAALPPSYPRGRRIKEPRFRILCKRWDIAAAYQLPEIAETIGLTADLYAAAQQLEDAERLANELPLLGFTRGNQLSTAEDFDPPPRPPTLAATDETPPNGPKISDGDEIPAAHEPENNPILALATQGALEL